MANRSEGETGTPAATGGVRAAVVAGSALLIIAISMQALFALGFLPRGSAGWERLAAFAPLGLGLPGLGLLLRPVRERPALLAAVVGTGWALLLAAYFRRPDGPGGWEGDASLFYRMAAEWPWRPGGWWRYRVLVPFAVHLLPLGIDLAWQLLAVASVAAAAPLVSLLLRDLCYGTAARNAGVALYLCSFAPLYNSYNYAMPDPAAMVVLLLAARALARGRDRELALWLAVGCVTKEVALFLVPVHFLLRRSGDGDRRALARTALVAAPAGILFLALRALPEEAANYAGFVTGNAWLFPWLHQPGNLARVYSPFAAGWGLLLVAALRPTRWENAGFAFGALVLLSLLVTDAGRMLVYLLPFAVPMMLDGAGMGPGQERPTARAVLLVALACLSMRMWEPFLLFWRVPEGPRRLAALALLPVLAVLAFRARRGGAAPAGA